MKKLLLILVLAFVSSNAMADRYDDDIETQRQQAEAEEEEYFIMMEDAEDDHNNGIENSDSNHSLEEHDYSNRYDY
jgi:hypothetical protein